MKSDNTWHSWDGALEADEMGKQSEDFGGGTGGSAGVDEAQKPMARTLKDSEVMAKIGHQRRLRRVITLS